MLFEFIKVFGYRLVLALAIFMTDVVLSRSLGPELKGQYYLLVITPILLSIVVSLGQDYALNYWGHSEPDNMFRLYMSSSVLVLIAGMLAFWFLYFDIAGSLSFIYSGIHQDFLLAKRLSFLSLLIEPFFIITAMLLVTRGKPVEYGKMRIVRRGGYLLAIFAVFRLMAGREETLFITLILVQLGAVIMSVVYGLLKSSFRFQWPGYKVKGLLAEGANSYLGRVAERFLLRMGSLILGALSTGAAVGYLSVALGISEVLFFVSGSLAFVLFSRSAKATWERHAQACRLVLPVVCVLALATGVGAQVGVPLLYGEEFSSSTRLVWILLPGTVFMSMVYTMSPLVVQRGLSRLVSVAYAAGFAGNVILCVLLIPHYGARGAAMSATVSYGVTWAIMLAGLRIYEKIPVSALLVITKLDLGIARQAFQKLQTRLARHKTQS